MENPKVIKTKAERYDKVLDWARSVTKQATEENDFSRIFLMESLFRVLHGEDS